MHAGVPSFSVLEAKLAVAYAVAAADGIHLPDELDAVNRMLGHRFASGRETLAEQEAAHRRVHETLEAATEDDVLQGIRQALQGREDRVEALTLALLVARADGTVDPRETETFQRLADTLDASGEDVEAAWYRVEG